MLLVLTVAMQVVSCRSFLVRLRLASDERRDSLALFNLEFSLDIPISVR